MNTIRHIAIRSRAASKGLFFRRAPFAIVDILLRVVLLLLVVFTRSCLLCVFVLCFAVFCYFLIVFIYVVTFVSFAILCFAVFCLAVNVFLMSLIFVYCCCYCLLFAVDLFLYVSCLFKVFA